MIDAHILADLPHRSVVLGYDGIEPRQELIDSLIAAKPFGIIFFTRNIESPQTLKSRIASFRAIDSGLEFLIDQEGGEKCRMRMSPFCPPCPWEMRDWSVQGIRDIFAASAEALAELGLTINLAPVADIGTGEYIRKRTFGTEPQSVAEKVVAALDGIIAGGLKPCAKHFPGLGCAGKKDPHLSLPATDILFEEFAEIHWLPFKSAISAGCPYIMTTHVLAKSLDVQSPATYSSATIGFLRNLGFVGKILTDDLAEMRGAGNMLPRERISAAIDAGHDIALWCTA